MDELLKLKEEKSQLERKIKELEENRKMEEFFGKCYRDDCDSVYYKILHISEFDYANYIRVNLNASTEDIIRTDYDNIDTFTDYKDTVEISKEEFNTVFDKAVKKIKKI